MKALRKVIEQLLEEAPELLSQRGYASWQRRLHGALRRLDAKLNEDLAEIGGGYSNLEWQESLEHQTALLEAVLLEESMPAATPTASLPVSTTGQRQVSGVFIVHGREDAVKERVARFVVSLGLEPIILHEQASGSKAVIEKLEAFANVAFAFVLLTPDDVGGLAVDAKTHGRARQNVIFELGFFIGRLGRSRVCALYVPGVELPSDYAGVVYVELDEKGAWRTKAAQELVQAGLQIRLDALLKS